jgi:excisionase family DNA binding protein
MLNPRLARGGRQWPGNGPFPDRGQIRMDETPSSSRRHHTIADLAERWRVSERTVRRLIDGGKLRALRIGNQLRVADDVVRRFEARNATGGDG